MSIFTDHKNKNVVYGLIDPNTKELRYIGITKKIQQRFKTHHSPSSLKKQSHKNNWLKPIILLGKQAEVFVFETCESYYELKSLERDLIAYYRFIGCNLTNLTDGGEGNLGMVHSQETKRKMSASSIGRKKSKEAIANWKKANVGKPSANKGKKASIELIDKLSKAHIGIQGKKRTFSPEEEIALYNEYIANKGKICLKDIAKTNNVSRDTLIRAFNRVKNNDWSI